MATIDMEQMQNEIMRQLLAKYGEKQVIVAMEELSELQKELCKALRNKGNKEHLIEEFADVCIMLEQMKIYFDLDEKEVNKVINEKIERTKARLL